MTQVPDKFPSYTSYSPKTLIMHVDTMKTCIQELQAEVNQLKAALSNTAAPTTKAKKETATNG